MRFKFLTGDTNWQEYGGKFVSDRLSNGEFDYWLVLEVMNWEDATGEKPQGNTYNVNLSAVSPSEAGTDKLKEAFDSFGFDDETLERLGHDPLVQVEALHSYGIHSPCWQADGTNLSKLMHQARQQAKCIAVLFGFYMDAPKNGIGTSGWDCLKGDILAGLNRFTESE